MSYIIPHGQIMGETVMTAVSGQQEDAVKLYRVKAVGSALVQV